MEEIEAKNDDNLVNQSILNSNIDSLTLKTEDVVIIEEVRNDENRNDDEEQVDQKNDVNNDVNESLTTQTNLVESKLLIEDSAPLQNSTDKSNMSFIESLTNVIEAQNENKDLVATRNETKNDESSGGNEFLSSSNESSATSTVKNPNSFTLVSDLASPKINEEQNQRNWQAISNSSSSSSSPSSASAASSSSSEAINSPEQMLSPSSPPENKVQKASHLLLSPNSDELNPKKNSPVPTTLTSNNIYIDTQLDRSSIDHSTSFQSHQPQQTQNIQSTNSQTSLLGRMNQQESTNRDTNNNNYDDNINIKTTKSGNLSSGPSSKQSGGGDNCNTTSPWSTTSSSKPCLHYHHNMSHQNQFDPTNKNVKFASYMDKCYEEMRRHILSGFSKEMEILKEHQKKLIEEKERQNSEMNRLRLEIDFQKETIKMYERYQLKKDETIEQLKKDIEKQCDRNQVLRDMMEWKLKRVEDSKEIFTLKVAENFHNNRLKQRWFYHWKLTMLEKNKLKLEKTCKKKAEEVCLDMATRYENKIKMLEEERLKVEDELRLSRLENERFRVELAKSEENMRKALMRGVCALNLEAMSIFNENIVQQPPETQPNTIATAAAKTIKLPKKSKNHSENHKDDLLARKVRQFCEARFEEQSKEENLSQPQLSAEFIRSKASKLARENSKSNENLKSVAESPNKPKIHSNNKIFDELIEHSHNIQQTLTKNTNIRSKINSIASSSLKSNRINNPNPKPNSSKHLEQNVLVQKHYEPKKLANTTNDPRFVTPITSFK